MKNNDWAITHKPFSIRERTFQFACIIVRIVQFLQRQGAVAAALSPQLLACGTSGGANVEEADGASSRRDFMAKTRIALREAKETHFRLRVLRASGYLGPEHDPVLHECDEIVRILGAIASKSR
jgi:four helix bundle protein